MLPVRVDAMTDPVFERYKEALKRGHVAVFRGPDHYTLADDPQTPPNLVVYPGQNCTSAEDGRGLARRVGPRRTDVGHQPRRRHRDAHRRL